MDRAGNIHSLLEMQGGIGAQPMPEGGFSDVRRVEPRAFQKDIPGGPADPGMETAKYARHGNAAFRIADHQVFRRQFPLLLIQRHEWGPLRQIPHDDLPAFDRIQVKCMQGLAQFMQDEIGDVDDIVDRPDADGVQSFLHPSGGFFDGDPRYAETGITAASLRG